MRLRSHAGDALELFELPDGKVRDVVYAFGLPFEPFEARMSEAFVPHLKAL